MRTLVVFLLPLLFPMQLKAQQLRTSLLTNQPVEAANPGTVPAVNSTTEPRAAWVRHYGSQNVPSKEPAQYAAAGRQGDLFVLGTFNGYPLTVKCTQRGDIRWADVYRSPVGTPDMPRGIGVDTSGNVFVVMQHLVSSTFPTNDYSCLVVKYNNDGKRLWVMEYPGSPRAAAVDPAGNTYLGLSWNPGGRPNRYGTSDYVILKISPEGTILWRTVYDGPWSGEDRIGALCVDGKGNVYVTGVAEHVFGSRIATLRLDAGGSMVWLGLRPIPPYDHSYFSSTSGMFYYPERQPWFLTVDSGGAVSVSGRSSIWYSQEAYDLVRYDASGREQWAQTTPGKLCGMAGDPTGDLYLATDAAIMRISASGAVRWTQSGTGASFVCYDTGLLFAGSTINGRMVTQAFDTAGMPRWSAAAPGGTGGRDSLMAFVCDGTGNPTAVGTRATLDGNTDFVGSTYSTQGTGIGTFRFDGPAGSNSRALVSAVDQRGNTIIAGNEYLPGGTVLAIVKYEPSGNMLYALRDSSAEARSVRPEAMTIDAQGGFRIAGFDNANVMSVLSYSNNGQLQWAVTRPNALAFTSDGSLPDAKGSTLPSLDHTYADAQSGPTSPSSQPAPNAPGSSLSSALPMATDVQGNTVVLSRSRGSSGEEALVMAFGPDGAEKWTQRYPGIDRYSNSRDLRLDPAGNVYVGMYAGTANAMTSVLLKYSQTGQLLWERKVSDVLEPLQGKGTQQFGGLSVDPGGRAVIAGTRVRGSDNVTCIYSICYSPSGDVLWITGSHEGISSFSPLSVLHCPDGGVWITGRGSIREYGMFLFACRYDSRGKQLSGADLPMESFSPQATAVDARGSLYVTGQPGSYRQGEDTDVFTFCFGPSGSPSWTEQFDAAPHAFDYAVGVAAAPDGGIVVAGYSGIPVQDGRPRETGTFFTAIKYEPLGAPGSLVVNPGFEREMASWTLHSDGSAKVVSVTGGEKSPLAACVVIDRPDSTITLFQAGIPLEPRTRYRLTFSGRCNTGHDVEVSLIKNTEPYASYGLSGIQCDLGREWTSLSMDFVTEWFTTLVNDGRIMFRFDGLAEAGDEYFFDNIVLERLGPPDIRTVVRHPADAIAGIGQRAMFRVVAPYATSVQWLRNGSNIPGATWDRYATPALAAADSGAEFSCVVTGPAGVFKTRAASLTVRNAPVSLVANHHFENGAQGWSFPSGAPATFTVEGPPNAGHATIYGEGTNLQLMTTGIELIEGARYRLRFHARSTSGHDLAVAFLKHTAPFAGYGPGLQECDLTPEWKEFSTIFIAGGFAGTVADARLMFWMSPYAVAGDDYFFDDVHLEEIIEGTTTGVGQEETNGPLTFRLEQNLPNPFNPETTIRFSIPERGQVRLAVYDVLGKEVAILAEGMLAPGEHLVRYRPDGLASGVYIYRLEGARQVLTGKMLMLR